MRKILLLITLIALVTITPTLAKEEDPYLWLEEVEGEKALTWVKEQSAATSAELEAVPRFDKIHEQLLEIYTSQDRIPNPGIRSGWIYNYWQDETHVRAFSSSLWRSG